MGISKDKLQKLLAQEKGAREQREKFYEQIIFDNDHLEMELGQEKRKNDRLLLKEYEYQEYIDQLKKENDRLNKELKGVGAKNGLKGISLTKEERNEIHSIQQKKLNEMEEKIKRLQDKLGENTVPLSVLAEGLMDYAEEAGISEAHKLFNHLNNILMNVPAWKDNVPQLKKFFRDLNKNNNNRNITMTGEYATYNENQDKKK